MTFRKIVLISLFVGCLTGCNSSISGSGGDSYLKLGDTISAGDFSQTLTEFNYVYTYSSDPNQVTFELIFDVHYSGDKIAPLSFSCKAIFDGDEKMGSYSFLDSGRTPSSVAPNDTFSLKLGFDCFKDWETVSVTCSYSKDVSSSFKLKSSDFNYSTNNLLPALKTGETISTTDGAATVKMGTIKRTDVGSAYAGSGDNVLATFTVTNNTNLKAFFTDFNFKFDGGFTDGRVSWSSPTQPTAVEANTSISFGLILIIQNKEWKNCVVETTFNQDTILKFNLNHNDFNY